MLKQKGFAPLLLLILAAAGIIVYSLISSTFPFKDKLFGLLYPKPPSFAAARDPLKWPFASDSIWNMPIGDGAVYVPANLNPDPGNMLGDPSNTTGSPWLAGMPSLDEEIIVLKPTAPL